MVDSLATLASPGWSTIGYISADLAGERDIMKSVASLRSRLRELLPDVFYVLPPEDAPGGLDDALSLWVPSEANADEATLGLTQAAILSADPGSSLEELFEFGAEADRDRFVQALGGTFGDSIRKSVEVRGVDALAWYVTLHATGRQWGIYVPVSSLVYLACEVFGHLRTDVTTALKLAFRVLHQHELFHFATDYMCTQLEVISSLPCHKAARSLRDPRLGYLIHEEEMANAYMVRALRGGPPSIRVHGRTAALRTFVAHQPPGYRDGFQRSHDVVFEAGAEELVWAYLGAIEYDSRGFECIDLNSLYPMWPSVDWRYCPVHIIHDESRLSLGRVDMVPFAKVDGIEETADFTKRLQKLPRHTQRAWETTKAKLACSTAGHGFDFKFWGRDDGGSV